ncbi:AsmA family protein [Candidatus Albibeggiatoa sp. nov. NOAA]|uniref:AsmA family protein n=1 Tax=Candidatus Albibeggiatoa sp. nov. NOAA TaxID=3162724 RepID=UPI0032FF6B87|nr:AsmA family protein [Thiotrichaceae bacterium]
MKWLKIGLGILVVLLMLIGLAIVAVTQWVDPNQYKPQITEMVEQNLGRQLTIEGDIQLSFFPWLGLQLGHTILNNPDHFEQQPFAAIQQAQVKVKLLPLLRQQVQIGQIQLDGVQLLLLQQKDGSNNWQDLAQTSEPEVTPEETDEHVPQHNAYMENLQIEGLNLKNASIVFFDEKQQTSYALQNTNIQTSAITLDQAIQIELDTLVNTSQLEHTVSTQLQTEITPNLNQQLFEFRNSNVTVASQLLPDALKLNLPTAQLDLNQQTLSIPKLVAQTLEATVTAQLNAQHILSAPTLIAKAEIQQPNVDNLLKQYNMPLPVKSANIHLDINATLEDILLENIKAQFDQYPIDMPSVKINFAQQQVEVEKLDLQALGTKLQLSTLKLQNFAKPAFSSQVKITDFNLKKWLPILKFPEQKTVDKKALTQLDLDADLTGDLQKVQLQNLVVKLDQTQIKGNIELSQFSNPVISLRLEADKLDADRYMPPSNPNQKATQPLLPLELLKALNVKGHIKLRKLTVTQMQLKDIYLQFVD